MYCYIWGNKMKKRRKNSESVNKKFNLVDIIVIISSIAAVIVLGGLLVYSKKMEINKQLQLQSIDENGLAAGSDISDGQFLELIINEVNESGWIELINTGDDDLKLQKCYINLNGNTVYTFEDDEVILSGERKTFDIAQKAGTDDENIVSLYDGSNMQQVTLYFPKLSEKESYGCITDASDEMGYISASQNEKNTADNQIEKDKLSFSIPGGFYKDAINLEITAAQGMKIYYTLDGSEPTTKSSEYKGSIKIKNRSGSEFLYADSEGVGFYSIYRPSRITMGTVVRAIAVDENGKKADEYSQTYFVDINLNNEVLNMPVLSITTNPENLFDYFDGIYVTGRTYEDAVAKGESAAGKGNFNNNWTKNTRLEFFEANKAKTYESDAVISILKDYSTTAPQKGFAAACKEPLKGSLVYNYFDDSTKTLNIQTNKRDNDYKIREYVIFDLLSDSNVLLPDMQPCAVFIDGEYWGGYVLRSQYTEQFIQSRYDLKSPVVIYQNNKINNAEYQALYDDFYNFVTQNDMSTAENYNKLKSVLDIQSYLDYLCANMYVANTDYASSEWIMWRSSDISDDGYGDGKWRFAMGKMDNTLGNINSKGLSSATIDSYLMEGVKNDWLLNALLNNQEFKTQLKDTMTNMAEVTFEKEATDTAIDSATKKMKKSAVSTYERFIAASTDTFYSDETDAIKKFFETRADYILKYTDEVIKQAN